MQAPRQWTYPTTPAPGPSPPWAPEPPDLAPRAHRLQLPGWGGGRGGDLAAGAAPRGRGPWVADPGAQVKGEGAGRSPTPGPGPTGRGGAGGAFPPRGQRGGRAGAQLRGGRMGRARRAARGRPGRAGARPASCARAHCFDPLLRRCVSCRLLRTPEPGRGKRAGRGGRRPGRRGAALTGPVARTPAGSPPADPRPSRPASPSARPAAAGSSAAAPGTALQPRGAAGAAGAGPGREAAPPLPALLLGAPLLLGLALALALVALLSWRWRWRRRRGAASAEPPDGGQDEPPDKVFVPISESRAASAPAWPPPGEESDVAPPGPGVPVPATELGSTELVTTKTAGPEQP
ncbi:tumor necrosis factor receptor superfamily member 13C [Thomomys bottae]